ncbi:hypothetical protein [Planctomicrobium sp. SH664]|uniref:hypothetical protein n=1 Tax=Planctomicrobium sp. SH664 TaxID=3448125 RepID=UPI003F5AE329
MPIRCVASLMLVTSLQTAAQAQYGSRFSGGPSFSHRGGPGNFSAQNSGFPNPGSRAPHIHSMGPTGARSGPNTSDRFRANVPGFVPGTRNRWDVSRDLRGRDSSLRGNLEITDDKGQGPYGTAHGLLNRHGINQNSRLDYGAGINQSRNNATFRGGNSELGFSQWDGLMIGGAQTRGTGGARKAQGSHTSTLGGIPLAGQTAASQKGLTAGLQVGGMKKDVSIPAPQVKNPLPTPKVSLPKKVKLGF